MGNEPQQTALCWGSFLTCNLQLIKERKRIAILHIALHFIVPAIVVFLFFKENWKRAYVVMMLTMLVDLDHLLATPIYDPLRCSIGFHPLHTFLPIMIYVGFCFYPKTRLVGVGLVIHMALDSIDCEVNGLGVFF